MNYICLQESERDCGFACLKMMLAKCHKNKDYLFLTKEKDDDYSLFDLKEIGRKYGLNLDGVRFDDLDLILSKKHCICQVTIENKQHFVFFEGVFKDKVRIVDPAFGKAVVSKDDFLEMFTGYALIINSIENVKYKKKVKRIPTSFIIAYASTLVIDLTLAYLISFFSKDSKYFFLVILAGFGICMSFFAKSLLIKANYNYIDKKYLINIDKIASIEERKDLLSFKSLTANYIYSIINSIGIGTFIVLLLLINEAINIVVLLVIAIAYTLRHIIENYKVTKEYQLLINEVHYLNSEENKKYYGFIAKFTNKLIQDGTYFKSVLFMIVICLISLINYFNNFNSLSFMIFSFGCYLILIERIDSLIMTFTRSKLEYNRVICIICRLNSKE